MAQSMTLRIVEYNDAGDTRGIRTRAPTVGELIAWALARELGTQLLDGLAEALDELAPPSYLPPNDLLDVQEKEN